MNIVIFGPDSAELGKIELPGQFSEPLRPDLIKRAAQAIQSHIRQPYGSDPLAGKRVSAKTTKRRRRYRGSYGHGIARIPRKVMSRRGLRFNWTGAFVPQAVGGMRAHPPKAEKVWEKKINAQERKKAIRSAIAGTIDGEFVKKRGHELPDKYPFVLGNQFESFSKTSQLLASLEAIGLKQELKRAAKKRIRAGKGKARGRKYKRAVGSLIVVGQSCPLLKAAQNIPGVDVVKVNDLNALILAPGNIPGRLALFTENAVKKMKKEKLFY